MEDKFEEGRQDVINSIRRTISSRLKFNDECIASDLKHAYTKDEMICFSKKYNEVLEIINLLVNKKHFENLIA